MPHHKSAIKRMKTNERDRKRSQAVKSEVRSAIRKVRETAAGEKAAETFRKTQSILDNAVRKGVLHKNTVNRRKSRLAKLITRSQAAPAPKKPQA
ncbi:MAG: 30S ribosomal protein S20 [Candidatus Eisenbacteria bacterium]|nr:30S ribosomal protein S20 [Candidatus Eisenbacteria bacterium]